MFCRSTCADGRRSSLAGPVGRSARARGLAGAPALLDSSAEGRSMVLARRRILDRSTSRRCPDDHHMLQSRMRAGPVPAPSLRAICAALGAIIRAAAATSVWLFIPGRRHCPRSHLSNAKVSQLRRIGRGSVRPRGSCQFRLRRARTGHPAEGSGRSCAASAGVARAWRLAVSPEWRCILDRRSAKRGTSAAANSRYPSRTPPRTALHRCAQPCDPGSRCR